MIFQTTFSLLSLLSFLLSLCYICSNHNRYSQYSNVFILTNKITFNLSGFAAVIRPSAEPCRSVLQTTSSAFYPLRHPGPQWRHCIQQVSLPSDQRIPYCPFPSMGVFKHPSYAWRDAHTQPRPCRCVVSFMHSITAQTPAAYFYAALPLF